MTLEVIKEDEGVTKKNKNYRITHLEGGGEVDMFKFIDGKGKFHIRIAPHIVNDHDYHVLYISESPGRVYGDVQWGNGCGNIFDLTKAGEQLMANKGLLVTTSKTHYLHVMAGYYIVFQLVEDRMLLGYIRIKDSRYPQFSCTL